MFMTQTDLFIFGVKEQVLAMTEKFPINNREKIFSAKSDGAKNNFLEKCQMFRAVIVIGDASFDLFFLSFL